MEGVNLGVATDVNISGYKLLIEETGKILFLNQVRFDDENLYPYRNRNMVSQHDVAELDFLSLGIGGYE